RRVVCFDEFVYQPMYEFDRLVAVAAIERDPGRPAELAPEVDDLAAEFAFAEVDADQVARVIGDAQENWRLPAARRATADFFGKAKLEELADEVGDGRPGQSRASRDIGPTDQVAVRGRAQYELAALRARLAVARHQDGGHSFAPLCPDQADLLSG